MIKVVIISSLKEMMVLEPIIVVEVNFDLI
jgi:hypothetical protein